MALTRAGSYPDYSSQATSKLIQQLYAKKLRNYYYNFDVIPFITNKDADNQSAIKQMGDKVIFRNLPSITVNNYSKGQTINYQTAEITTVELDIDKAKYFALTMDMIDKFQADMDYLDKFAQHGALMLTESICTAFMADIYDDANAYNMGASAGYKSGNINLGASGTPRVITKDNVLYWFNDMAQVLDEQNIPQTDRHVVVSPAIQNLIMSSDLKNACFAGNGQSSILSGKAFARVAGFDVHVTNNIHQATDGSYHAYDVVFNHKDAIAFCMQIQETKFIESLENTFGSGVKVISVYGYKSLSPKAQGYSRVALAI